MFRFCGWLVDEDEITANPMKTLSPPQVPEAARPAMDEWRRLDDLITEELDSNLAEMVNAKGQAAATDDKQAREAIKAGKPFAGAVAEADRAKGEATARQHLATARQMHAEQGRVVVRELKGHRDGIAALAAPVIIKAANAYAALLDAFEQQARPLVAELTLASAALGTLADLDAGEDIGAAPMTVSEPSLADARASLFAIRRRTDAINEKGVPTRITIRWKDSGEVTDIWYATGIQMVNSGIADLVDAA